MLLIRKTEQLFDGYDRIVFVKPLASWLSWFLPLCTILNSHYRSRCILWISGKLIRKKFTRIRGGWSSGNLVHTSYTLTPPLSYCGQARRESLPTRHAGGYDYNLDLWFFVDFAFDRKFANLRALRRWKIFRIRLNSAWGHCKIPIDGSPRMWIK